MSQFDLQGKQIPEKVEEKSEPKLSLRQQNTIYFHTREDLHHFLLKCAICFVLHRRGKQFKTEQPFKAMKLERQYGYDNEHTRYEGRNEYDVYCVDDDQPFEILIGDMYTLPSLIKRKRDEYPPNTVFVIYDFEKPDIERIVRERLVPLWIFKTNEYHLFMSNWDHPSSNNSGPAMFSNPFKEYNTVDDVLPAIAERYDDVIEDWLKYKTAKTISEARRKALERFKAVPNVSPEAIDSHRKFLGVLTEKAVQRRINKLKDFGIIDRFADGRMKMPWTTRNLD